MTLVTLAAMNSDGNSIKLKKINQCRAMHVYVLTSLEDIRMFDISLSVPPT